MGEAKRRGAPSRLPDFIFGRDRVAEKAGGFTLAGKLVTDIPKTREPTESETSEITELINTLVQEAKRDPDMHEVGAWRSGAKPPDGLSPPFPDAAMRQRVERCAVIAVRIDPRDDGLRLDDGLLAEIMGRH